VKLLFDSMAVAPGQRAAHWVEAVAKTYYPLDVRFRRPDTFEGRLALWDFGECSLSRNISDAQQYTRHRHHLADKTEEYYLVTFPHTSAIHFSQAGASVVCKPGQLILERSYEPYEFTQELPNDLKSLKVPARMLRGYIRSPDRFCAIQFDASAGIGGLLVNFLDLIPSQLDQLVPQAGLVLGRQVAELLALTLSCDNRTLTAGMTSVRDAHLARIESFVRSHLGEPDLNPERIANASGISVRYLHQLFRDTDQTLGEWIRRQRLLAAHEALSDGRNKRTIAEVAFRCGFNDQAQFSRSFKAEFGHTPSELKRQGPGQVPVKWRADFNLRVKRRARDLC
jgi:AraC-like DNA-binding protein